MTDKPEPGDRVRVTEGQFTGWEGVVRDVLSGVYLWVDLGHGLNMKTRALLADEVEVIR